MAKDPNDPTVTDADQRAAAAKLAPDKAAVDKVTADKVAADRASLADAERRLAAANNDADRVIAEQQVTERRRALAASATNDADREAILAGTAYVKEIAQPIDPDAPVPAGMVKILSPRAFNITLSRHDIPDELRERYNAPLAVRDQRQGYTDAPRNPDTRAYNAPLTLRMDAPEPYFHHQIHIPQGDSIIPAFLANHFALRMHGVRKLA